MDEVIWRRLLGTDTGEVWLAIAFLVILFVVAVWRPDRIGNPRLFRTAGILFALSLLIPPLADTMLHAAFLDIRGSSNRRAVDTAPFLVGSALALTARLFFALGVVCGLASIDIRGRKPEGNEQSKA